MIKFLHSSSGHSTPPTYLRFTTAGRVDQNPKIGKLFHALNVLPTHPERGRDILSRAQCLTGTRVINYPDTAALAISCQRESLKFISTTKGMTKRNCPFTMNIMEEIFEIRSWIEILANDIRIYTVCQHHHHQHHWTSIKLDYTHSHFTTDQIT